LHRPGLNRPINIKMKLKTILSSVLLSASVIVFTNCSQSGKSAASAATVKKGVADTSTKKAKDTVANATVTYPPLDKAKYDTLSKYLAHGDTTGRWPVKHTPYPLPGAILPFHRIIAFYGNLYSKKMGVLGEYAPKEMLSKLKVEQKRWEKADPKIPTIAALHYICVTAQGAPGKNGLHNMRMPDKQIDSILHIAKTVNAIVFLDVQVGFSNVQTEIPRLEKYLKMPNVHLGIDPEFSMKEGSVPGKRIGTYDATDVNFTTNYLAGLVRKYNLPPKVFILHRFTRKMVSNVNKIKLHPEVQFVMDMDGWGEPDLKIGSYRYFVSQDPVQFTGFKLFYKNDLKKAPNHMMTPEEVLKLKPNPIYIQYQ
jgi:hypothetical protein